MLDRLAAVGVVRRSLLVIPNFRDGGGIDEHEALHQLTSITLQDDGDEMVLHGYKR